MPITGVDAHGNDSDHAPEDLDDTDATDGDGGDGGDGGTGDPEDAVDVAVIAYLDDGVWQLDELEPELALDFESMVKELRRRAGDDGAIALAAYDEDFWIVVRTRGSEVQVLLSDVTAALEWDVAHGALDSLDEDLPDEDDDPEAVGDVDLLEDFGLDEDDVDALLDDDDLRPDEVLAEIAEQAGFGVLFDEVVESTGV